MTTATMKPPDTLLLLLGLLLCSCFQTSLGAVSISSAGPRYLSRAGGTRLFIRGSGFSVDRYQGANAVFVGKYPCNVIDHLTSETTVGVGWLAVRAGGA